MITETSYKQDFMPFNPEEIASGKTNLQNLELKAHDKTSPNKKVNFIAETTYIANFKGS